MTDPARILFGEGGGGKGGGGSSPKEAPNNLKSYAYARILDVLGEGPIVGLKGGRKGVYFNDTPLQNADGTDNFKGVQIEERTGTPSQDFIPGFEATASVTAVNTEVKNLGNPISNAVIRRISDTNVSAVRVIMQIEALFTTDTKTGDMNGHSVSYVIAIKSDADNPVSQYVTKVTETVVGKCTSPYQRSYKIALSGTGPWDIRVHRVSADDAATTTRSVTAWVSYGALKENKLSYPNTALVGVLVEAEQFGNQIPARSYLVDGLILKIPSNYDPAARVYSGVWNGTFTTGFTNNPAWVLYDLVTNKNYGLGDVISDLRVDKWSLYQIAKYCDELVFDGKTNAAFWVPRTEVRRANCRVALATNVALGAPGATLDGVTMASGDRVLLMGQAAPAQNGIYVWNGAASAMTRASDMNIAGAFAGSATYVTAGTYAGRFFMQTQIVTTVGTTAVRWCGVEPRFVFNGIINSPMKAYEALSAIAGMFRTTLLWSNGQIRFFQDSPGTPVRVFSPANVIEGAFNYTGTALTARHTVARVTWVNPKLNYGSDVTLVEDKDGIERYGWNPMDVTAYGCTSESQAYRHGLYALTTERLETDSVQFKIGLAEMDLLPGELIKISDPLMTTAEWAGRMVSYVSSGPVTVTFDRPVTLAAGRTYTLTMVLGDNTLASRQITSAPGTYATVTIASAFPVPPVVNAIWAIESDVQAARTFRVMGITEEDDTYKIFAVEHDPSKYALCENTLVLPNTGFSDLPSTTAVSPVGAITLAYGTAGLGSSASTFLELDWVESTDPWLRGYQVQYQYGTGNWQTLEETKEKTVRLVNPPLTTVRIVVFAINQFGVRSAPAVAEANLATTNITSGPTGSRLYVQGTTGTSWTGQDLPVEWSAYAPSGLGTAQLNTNDGVFKDYRVRLMTAANAVLRTYYTPTNRFTIPYADMNDLGLARTYKVGISVRDLNDNTSTELVATFTNPAPTVPVMTFTASASSVTINLDVPSDPDFEGTIIWLSTTNGFTPGAGNRVFKGKGSPTLNGLAPSTTYYVRAAHYDGFGETGLSVSGQSSFTTSASSNSLITIDGNGVLNGIGTAGIFVNNAATVPTGTLAGLPATGSYVGQQYFATDVGRMFRWNGSAWVLTSDVTVQHTAAAITGQGVLATRNNVDLATGDVLNRSLAVLDSTASATLTTTAALMASRRKRIGTLIVSPTTTYQKDVGALFNSDGTVDIVFQWGWAGDENTIDGFRVTYRQGQAGQGRTGMALGGSMFFA